MTRHQGLVDRIGVLASSLCAIHCALCARLPAAFGALGVGFLTDHVAEWAFALVAAAFALAAGVHGWRRHPSPGIGAALLLGTVGLLTSRAAEEHGFGPALGSLMGVVTRGLVGMAHMVNFRAMSNCCVPFGGHAR